MLRIENGSCGNCPLRCRKIQDLGVRDEVREVEEVRFKPTLKEDKRQNALPRHRYSGAPASFPYPMLPFYSRGDNRHFPNAPCLHHYHGKQTE